MKSLPANNVVGLLTDQEAQTISAKLVAESLVRGFQLDRPQTRRLLRNLEKFEWEVSGSVIMQEQLRGVLARKDWLVISISADAATVRTTGVSIGIVQARPAKRSAALTPLQKMQRKNGLRGAR